MFVCEARRPRWLIWGAERGQDDRAALTEYRANWGFFRDRRPDLYGALIER